MPGKIKKRTHLNEIPKNHITMGFKHCKSDEKDETMRIIIRPQHLCHTMSDPSPMAVVHRVRTSHNLNTSSNGNSRLNAIRTHRKQKNKFRASVFSKWPYSSGSVTARSCCSVDSCIFIPL